jgi:Nucleotidyltransferase domain
MDRLPAVVEPAVVRLRELESSAVAVLVGGSYARDSADELSDLDLTAIVEHGGDRYYTWFQERGEQRPLHVSAGVRTATGFLARREIPAGYWLGLPAIEPARYAWSTDDAKAMLGDDPSIRRPASPPELEDFFEFSMKVKRAALTGDAFGLRVWALSAAELAPRLLLPLNPAVLVSSRREAAEAALTFPLAPEHYVEDLSACLGLTPADDEALKAAALRLGLELLAFLRQHKPDVDPSPDLVDCLRGGALERQLAS